MDEEMGEKRRQDKIYTEKNSEGSQSEVTRGYRGLGKEHRPGSPVLALPLPSVWPRASSLSAPFLSFFICKMRVITESWGWNEREEAQVLSKLWRAVTHEVSLFFVATQWDGKLWAGLAFHWW